jgi:hypothetical protein
MNTKELKKLNQVEQMVLENKGFECFHTWGSELRKELYHFLYDNFKEKGINCFVGMHGTYFVSFRHGGENDPNEMNVEKLTL